MPKIAYASVDDYIASQPESVQPLLASVRSAIRKAVPRAEESISYNLHVQTGRPPGDLLRRLEEALLDLSRIQPHG
jgi:hypothetical protein